MQGAESVCSVVRVWYIICVMEKKSIVYGVLVVVLLVIVVGLLWVVDQQAAPKREAHARLAQCLSDEEVVFYGAFWCPACAQQKAMFGGSVKKLPYTECSLPDRTQNELCIEAEIANYPVWEFARENEEVYRCGGIVSPEILAHVSGCPLPDYEGLDNTVAAMYDRLVVEATTDSLQKRGVPIDTIQETIDSVTEAVNEHLTDAHGTVIDNTDSVEHLLTAIAETLHNCAPFEPQVEEELLDIENAEVELVPVGEEVDSGDDGE